MKAVKMLLPRLIVFAILLSGLTSNAQTLTKKSNLNINSNLNGLLELLPSGYNPANTSQKYPLLIFFQGINSTGAGTDPALQGMITGSTGSIGNGYIQDQYANNAWVENYTVNGNTYQFIVLIPQFVTNFNIRYPTASEVDDLLDYAVANYNVDLSRIYLTGNSSGGGIVYDYVGAASEYANRVAAILPFSGVSFPVKEKADVIRNADVAVWAFHNLNDASVPASFTQKYVELINTPTPAVPEAKATIYNTPSTVHDSWFDAYNRIYTENGLNIYQWMLQFSRTLSAANAGDDINITLPVNSTQLNASWNGAGTVTSYSWQQLSGPTSGNLASTNISNPSVNNLVEGVYTFRVTINSSTGATATDDVVVTVYPVRIQAELYANASGVNVISTIDEGGGSTVTDFSIGDWVEYSIVAPATGTYTIRFRVSADNYQTTPRFEVKNASGTVLATVNPYWTLGWENYTTLSTTITLTGSPNPQTIRIESVDTDPFNLNWLQIFAPTSANGPLPLKFVSLNAGCTNNTIAVRWQTADEVNVKEFSIQRSVDGREWKGVGTLPSKASQGNGEQYSYTYNGEGGLFRIAARDIDGKETLSDIVKANCNRAVSIEVFPNPVIGTASLQVVSGEKSRFRYTIVDQLGAVILRGERAIQEGTNQVSIDLSRLSKGAYTLVGDWAGQQQNIRIIKQ